MSDVVTSSTPQGSDVGELLARFRITDDDLALIKKFGEKIEPELEKLIDDFYNWLSPQPFFSHFFPNERRVTVTKAAQVEHMRKFFTADIDEAYLQSRRDIGSVHARVELPLDIYIAGVSVNFENCAAILALGGKPTQESQRTLVAISKLMVFDMMIIADTYTHITNETMIEQSKSLIEMSTPVTSIWDGILLLPLVGVIDSKRALDITARVLEEIANTQSSVMILDISGVAIIDTAVANYLIKITKATRLMGCESLISGLSPAIAQTIVDLGIDVGTIQTTGNLRDALRLAFSSVGLTVSDK